MKVADVLAEVVPQFDELIGEFSDTARKAMAEGARAAPGPATDRGERGKETVRAYSGLLARHHGRTLPPGVVDDISGQSASGQDWLNSLDDRRRVFREVTKCLDQVLGVQTSSEVAYEARQAAMRNVGFGRVEPTETENGTGTGKTPFQSCEERFVDTEIVAIYW